MKTFGIPLKPQTLEISRPLPLKKEVSSEAGKEKLYKSAKEMESLFLYYVLKAMRQTIPENGKKEGLLGSGGGLGKDIYTQIFDEELSRRMAGMSDRSLTNVLYRSLEKTVAGKAVAETSKAESGREIFPRAKYLKIKNDMPKFIEMPATDKSAQIQNADPEKSRPAVTAGAAAPVRRIITSDPDQGDIEKGQAGSVLKKPDTPVTRSIPTEGGYDHIIKEAAKEHNLNPKLLEAIIRTESSGNRLAVSPAGAKGLMQLADTTASDMGVKDVFDVRENINAGAKFLRRLLDRFGDIGKALAAYNAGPETVKRYGGIPPYPETKKYVQTVLKAAGSGSHNYE